MNRFTQAIRKSVEGENWYSALTTAITLPDVCGRLETPAEQSGKRYARWFDQWMGSHYRTQLGANRIPHTFFSGTDCYALRCSYLHQGESDISGQSAQKIRAALTNFHFITPLPGSMIHCNQSNNTLQLQIDIFSIQMANAVDQWAASVKGDQDIQGRMQSLLVIHDSRNGIRF